MGTVGIFIRKQRNDQYSGHKKKHRLHYRAQFSRHWETKTAGQADSARLFLEYCCL